MKRLTTFLVFAIAVLLSIPTQARLRSWNELTLPEYVSTSGILPGNVILRSVNQEERNADGTVTTQKVVRK